MFSKIFRSKYFSVFLITFVNGLSMTMLFPVLPFIVKWYNQPEIVLGILLASFSFFQLFAAPIMGALSDMYGRKPLLLLTQFGTFLSWIILGVASFVPDVTISFLSLPILVIFLSRVFDGITGGNVSVAQAILADMSTPDERSKIFGLNGAVFWFSLIIGPAIGGLTLASDMWYLLTALVGGFISLIAFVLIFFFLRESLPVSKRQEKMKVSFKKMNIFAQFLKWKHLETVRYTILMKVFIFFGFVGYTSISTLYLIDRFNFSELQTWLYLTFTGSFLIFHQAVSIRYFIKKYHDRMTLLIGMLLMGIAFFLMWLATSIIIFTMIYFFAVMGISLCFATLSSLLSRSVDEKNQGEIMGMSSSFESFISILAPILFTGLYTWLSLSPYLYLGFLPLFWFIISRVFFRNIEFRIARKNTL